MLFYLQMKFIKPFIIVFYIILSSVYSHECMLNMMECYSISNSKSQHGVSHSYASWQKKLTCSSWQPSLDEQTSCQPDTPCLWPPVGQNPSGPSLWGSEKTSHQKKRQYYVHGGHFSLRIFVLDSFQNNCKFMQGIMLAIVILCKYMCVYLQE